MIGAGVLLDEITGTPSYLTAAETTAGDAVSYFGIGTTLQSQGPAFNAIYFRDLFVLNQVQRNKDYRSEARAYATYMWTERASSGLSSKTDRPTVSTEPRRWSSSIPYLPGAPPDRRRQRGHHGGISGSAGVGRSLPNRRAFEPAAHGGIAPGPTHPSAGPLLNQSLLSRRPMAQERVPGCRRTPVNTSTSWASA